MRFRVSSKFLRARRSAPAEPPADPVERPKGSSADIPAPTAAHPAAAHSTAAQPVIVPKWVQLVLLPLALLGLWALARAAGPVLLILIAASTVALILNPLVKRFERRRVPRGPAILIIYVGIFVALGGIGILLSNPVSTQVNRFAQNVPSIIRHANHDLASLQHFLNRQGIHVKIQQQGQTALQTLQKSVLKSSGSIVSFSRDLLGRVITIFFYLVLVLVLSIYLLVYGKQIGELVRRAMPLGDGSPEDDYPLLVQRAVFGYIRGQLLFSVVMGTSAGLALWVIGAIGIFPAGAHYAVFFGVFYGLAELIPYVGPILGAAPPVLVALFNDPISAVWVTLMFVLLQQLEGHIVAPQVFRISLRINPILIILSLLIGFQIYGVAGALLALPVAAVLRETVVYLRRHLVLEPWGSAESGSGLLLTAPGGAPPPSPEAPPDTPHEAEPAYRAAARASRENH
jgi:predicted PurR-regulated permease PerM